MKNKKIIVILLSVFLLSGCAKNLVDPNTKKLVVDQNTNQPLVQNIYCQPEDQKVRDKYNEYKDTIDIEKLPKCENMNLIGKYEGLFERFITRPIAWFIIQVSKLVKNFGLAFIIAAVIVRIIILPLGISAKKETAKMTKMQPELNKLNKKYEGKTDQESMFQRAMEQQMLMKKYDIKMGRTMLVSFIQIPIFFGIFEAIKRIPAIFEDTFLTMNLGISPYLGLINEKNILYIVIVIINAIVTYFSFKQLSKNNPTAQGGMYKTMTIFIVLMSLFMQSALVIYWITTTLFGILQNSNLLYKEDE